MKREYEDIKDHNRPDMERIEYCFKTFERPHRIQSREMADYIYKLEEFINKVLK